MGALDGFGLGIYGDPINPDAWRMALLSVQRVLKSGGRFYLCASIGKDNKLRFNAGRIFTLDTILDTLNQMQLDELHFIKGDELETYPCIYHKDDRIITNEKNMQYLRTQYSTPALMVLKKIK